MSRYPSLFISPIITPEDQPPLSLMPDDFVISVTNRYIELFEKITGTTFLKGNATNIIARIEQNVTTALNQTL